MRAALLAVALLVAAAWLAQLGLVLGYRAALRRRAWPGPESGRLPRFGVVLPVRGLDPELPAALRSLLAQDHPSFELVVVVDSQDDPAWPVVEHALAEATNARLHALRVRRPTCSLVCSSLLEALDRLDPACELIAFAAADLVVPPGWLRELAVGMSDGTAGGTLGNRWYAPPEGSWGSLVRQQWNAGAVVLMRLLRVPWAGGLALRRKDVDELALRATWERALVEDVSVASPLAAAGRPLRFLPGLLVAHRDEVDVPAAFRFMARQLLWARLYHPSWPLVLAHALAGSATLLLPVAAGVLAALAGEPRAAALALASLGGYVAGMAGLLLLVDGAVRPVLSASSQEPQRWTARLLLRSALAVPVSQLAYTAASLHAAAARTVTWRGVTYEVRGPLDVRLVSDERADPRGAPGEAA